MCYAHDLVNRAEQSDTVARFLGMSVTNLEDYVIVSMMESLQQEYNNRKTPLRKYAYRGIHRLDYFSY